MTLQGIYSLLYSHFGPQGWWPGDSSFEHFIGCILAQNTRWDRVVPVIERLKNADLLSPSSYLQLSAPELENHLIGCGTYRRKALYLRNAGEYMLSQGWDGSPESVTLSTHLLRQELLSLKGIGQETCDCILLYVLNRPVFVVDAYTRRILSRHELCRSTDSYQTIQELFDTEFQRDLNVFKEYHALLVACGKSYCRSVPRCENCPLSKGGL